MTTVTITGTIPGQYTLAAPGNVLSVTTTGYIDGGGTTGGVFSPGIGAGDTIFNDGRIKGGSYGVELAGSGTIANGSATDTTASIVGGSDGIYAFTSGGYSISIANFGTISSKPNSNLQAGVWVNGEGTLTNGSASDMTALIEGGVRFKGSGTVENFATITSTGTKNGTGVGVSCFAVNGAPSDASATIYGATVGVVGATTNYGTIRSPGTGVVGGGVNGSGAGSSALIEGATGAVIGIGIRYGFTDTLTNHGTVLGTDGFGLSLNGGYVFNGGLTDSAAIIEGSGGAHLNFGGLYNFGTIIGEAASSSSQTLGGVVGLGFVENGEVGGSKAMIEGVDLGVDISGTVINFGTIEATGVGGYAVRLIGADGVNETLVVEPGSSLIGKVNGGGGVLDFASGMTGKITNLGSAEIVANGTDYQDFGTLQLKPGTTFIASGAGTIASGGLSTLDVQGNLDIAGAIVVTDALVVNGAVEGKGHLELKGGTSSFTAGSLAVANVLVAGAHTYVELYGSLDYSGDWQQAGGNLGVAYGDLLQLTGVGDALSGSVTGAGAILVSGAGDTFDGLTLSLSTAVISGGSATNAGLLETTGATHLGIHATTIVNSGGTISASAGSWIQLQGVDVEGGTLSSTGTGRIKINGANNEIDGGSSSISLAGEVVVQTGATLTGAGAVAVAFSGQLVAEGEIAISGPVSGAGGLIIDGGIASFGSAFSQAVAFDGAGALILADSQGFSGSVARFGMAGADTLDLEDITFGGSTRATFSGTRSGGILTVTDGTHTARIALKGDYLASTFTVASDGAGGTVVTDPKASAPAMASAMAAFTPASAAASPAVAPTAQSLAASLIPPHG